MTARRDFLDTAAGQLHVRATQPVEGATTLVCLHATAYSSQSFLPLMRALDGRRQVIAVDAPGYGDSDPIGDAPAIADYAAAVEEGLGRLATGPVALLGYHTGAYIACEMAIRRPEAIRALTLVGIPYFAALDLHAWRERLCHRHSLGETLDQFDERWAYLVANRHPDVSLPRAFANFVDELKAWPDGAAAHGAMFAWDADARLPLVRQLVQVFNPAGHLAQASRVAAAKMARAQVVDRPELKGPVLELGAEVLADTIHAWLSETDSDYPGAPAPAPAEDER